MSDMETNEPNVLLLPGSVNDIMTENPMASYEDAVVAQQRLLIRYRSAAAVALQISLDELHHSSPSKINQKLTTVSGYRA